MKPVVLNLIAPSGWMCNSSPSGSLAESPTQLDPPLCLHPPFFYPFKGRLTHLHCLAIPCQSSSSGTSESCHETVILAVACGIALLLSPAFVCRGVEVMKVQQYGCFVALDSRTHALVNVSELDISRVADPAPSFPSRTQDGLLGEGRQSVGSQNGTSGSR